MSQELAIPSRWKCADCGGEFYSAEEAVRCATPPESVPCVKVGDIVLARSGFGWFDGDPEWIENFARIGEHWRRDKKCPNGDSNCFAPCCTYQFFYVVTRIDHREGHWRYHLFTKAMTGKQGYASGYVTDRGRGLVALKKVPLAVVKSSKPLLGVASPHGL